MTLNTSATTSGGTTSEPSPQVRWQSQPGQEREVPGYNKQGAPRYSNRHWVDVTNTGDADAHDVTFEPGGDSFWRVLGGEGSTIIHAGQTRRVPALYTLATVNPVLRIHWTEDGEAKQQDFHVG